MTGQELKECIAEIKNSTVPEQSKKKIVNLLYGQMYTNGWIPCRDKNPEEGINPVTQDFYGYQVTFQSGDVTDIRHYKFGNGHWWNGGENMDGYVVAWQPRPEAYQSDGSRATG
ncbi:hypothetical protein D7V82_14625 [bacterium 1xD8-6]|nr:hypothetical protein D7V72_16005 [bacterium D16-36]RKI66548.1 hypothetical protein D7V82_14625 [bacterium 1xD8-6]